MSLRSNEDSAICRAGGEPLPEIGRDESLMYILIVARQINGFLDHSSEMQVEKSVGPLKRNKWGRSHRRPQVVELVEAL